MANRFIYPRPEYPRPDRQRGSVEGLDWLNLNGPWQFRFDGDRRGVDEAWFQPEDLNWREQIIVPFCWESLAAWGEGDAASSENYYAHRVFLNPLEVTRENHRAARRYEIGWYRRFVEIPNTPVWQNKRVILTIGAADFFTDGWCNGQHLGHHEGGYTPFEFDLTDHLSPPNQEERRSGWLVLRVEDPMDNREQPVGKQWCWYTTTSGIWQTVFIEPRSASHISSFRIRTDIDKSMVSFHIDCAQGEGCSVAIEVTQPEGDPFRATGAVENGLAASVLPVPVLKLWDPNQPHLYDTTLRLMRDGEVLDVVRTYFGMRKIDAAPIDSKDGQAVLRLNGVPRCLRGALYQSFFPEGVYTAGDVQQLKNDILAAKRYGFNFLRIHIKIDDPLLLHYADVLGILLMADFPNFGEGGDTPLGRQRFETMLRAAIQRDFNHPSIFAWCIFNETWGFGGQLEFVKLIHPAPPETKPGRRMFAKKAELVPKIANLGAYPWVRSMWELAKRLDPTRLIEDMSVVHWEHLDYYGHTVTDINSWHFYNSDYASAREHIQKVVQSTYVGSGFNYVPGFQYEGQPLINSEYGGVGALDGDRDVSWSFKFLTNELRRYPQISGYIYTELHDVEWEYNGFLNYDRTPKDFGYDPTMINESDVLPVDAPPVSRVCPGDQVSLEVASSHYSTRRKKNVVLQWRLAGIDTCGRIYQDLAHGSAPIAFPHYRVAHAHTIQLQMPSSTMLCTLQLQAITADGRIVARNFLHYFVSSEYPQRREEPPRGLILRGLPAAWQSAEWSGGYGNHEDELTNDSCYGHGHGYFEWVFPLGAQADLNSARRLKVLCEASSRRMDTPQTDDDTYPTTLQMTVSGVRMYEGVLKNHPHDSRGVLSYLRDARGAYGYLINARAEGELLREIASRSTGDEVRLRCAVPAEAPVRGGLTIYGACSGQYPICPTIIVEW
jgi:hypothetical protein